MDEAPAIVVVGAASRDLVDDDPRGWRLGGGVSYAALQLGRLGLRVGALVGADATAADAQELDLLRAAGVDVAIAALDHGPVFINTETPSGRVQRTPDVADPVEPGALPSGWRDTPAWLFAPVAAELPDAWAGVPPAGARVALGWQGLLRVLRAGEVVTRVAPAASSIVTRADLVGVGRDDFDPSIPDDAIVALLRPGATLLLTDGAQGGVAIDVGTSGLSADRRTWDVVPVRTFVDPVGAGDTFLAAVFAARVQPDLVGWQPGSDRDLRLGAAVSSLICEGPGLLGVPSRDAALGRMSDVA